MSEQEQLIVNLKSAVENSCFCTEHDIKPTVALSENNFTFDCCCDTFRTECIAIAKELAEVMGLSDLLIS
jgi:hypothetical protein